MTTAVRHDSLAISRMAPRRRRGMGALDLLVAFTLLMTVMTAVTPLVVRYHRVVKSHRNYRLALDEVSNHLDRLTALPTAQLPQAIQQIAPSPFIQERLNAVKITGELHPAEAGTRVTLRITWGETERSRAPLTISGWVFDSSTQTAAGAAPAVAP